MIYCHIRTARDGGRSRRCDLASQYRQIAHQVMVNGAPQRCPAEGALLGGVPAGHQD
jgi:hypothetical protein